MKKAIAIATKNVNGLCTYTGCPQALRSQDGEIYIIGKVVETIPEDVARKIGQDEGVVRIPREDLAKVIAGLIN